MTRHVVAHEFGHVFGVGYEGPACVCGGGSCRAQSYGTPYSVMGHGWGDYNVFEKFLFGWVRVEDRPAPARTRWPRSTGRAPGYTGSESGRRRTSTGSSTGRRSLLLLADPVGQVVRETGDLPPDGRGDGRRRGPAPVRLTDRVRPRPPRLISPRGIARARVRVAWRPSAEAGSGVDRYEVRLDGGAARVIPVVRRAVPGAELPVRPRTSFAARPGRHRVAVAAVDRAGNRGARARLGSSACRR